MSAQRSDKRDRFVAEYLVDNNATKAALRAGYSKRSAHVSGHRLTKNAKIAAKIAKAQERINQRCMVTREQIINMMKEDRDFARDLDQASAAANATMNLARVTGNVIERRNVRVITGFDDLDDEELERLARSEK